MSCCKELFKCLHVRKNWQAGEIEAKRLFWPILALPPDMPD